MIHDDPWLWSLRWCSYWYHHIFFYTKWVSYNMWTIVNMFFHFDILWYHHHVSIIILTNNVHDLTCVWSWRCWDFPRHLAVQAPGSSKFAGIQFCFRSWNPNGAGPRDIKGPKDRVTKGLAWKGKVEIFTDSGGLQAGFQWISSYFIHFPWKR